MEDPFESAIYSRIDEWHFTKLLQPLDGPLPDWERQKLEDRWEYEKSITRTQLKVDREFLARVRWESMEVMLREKTGYKGDLWPKGHFPSWNPSLSTDLTKGQCDAVNYVSDMLGITDSAFACPSMEEWALLEFDYLVDMQFGQIGFNIVLISICFCVNVL